MSYPSIYGRPALRPTIDVQLQTAFSDGNWPTVVRLAEQRFKNLKDPYYEAIKHCAQSQLDTTNDSFTALVAIQELVQSKLVTDADVLHLYEWALLETKPFPPEQYAATLGTLRARWVKANPKSPASVQCLEACVRRWDLVNAQQIAVALDKAHATSKDHRYMFWNIVLTYLLSTSNQAAESTRKLYSMLTLKQLQRAAEITETSNTGDSTIRGLLAEDEVYLYYRVLVLGQSKDELLKLFKGSKLGALQQLRDGRQFIFTDAVAALQSWENWDAVLEACLGTLDSLDNGVEPSLLAANWKFWKTFIQAASKARSPDVASAHIEAALTKLLAGNVPLNAMQQKNLNMVLLDKTFRIPQTLPANAEGAALPATVAQLVRFLARQNFIPSTFDDVKGYLDLLSLEHIKALLVDALPKLKEQISDDTERISFGVLEHKIRYFFTTSPQTLSPHHPTEGEDQTATHQCQICATLTTKVCKNCLQRIAGSAVKFYQDLAAGKAGQQSHRSDLALVIAMSLLKLGNLGERALRTQPSLQLANKALFLQGVLVVDSQLKSIPGDIGLRLLLSQLYLILGCASLAYQTWVPLDIKRTIQDALSPLFFDRISTLSPGLFQGSRPLMEPLRSYYANVFQNNSPLKVWDAFNSGSYGSILDMAAYDSALRRSCTLVMTVVEERRATRAFGGKLEDNTASNPLLRGINHTTTLASVTDYGSLPNFESSRSPPLRDLVRFGPELSSERCHLALLTEQYLDLVTIKPPKEFKPLKPNEVASRSHAYLMDSLTQVHHHISNYIDRISPLKVTENEHLYYSIVSQLAALLLSALQGPSSGPSSGLTSSLTASIRLSLVDLQTDTQECMADTFQAFSSMHLLSTCRDAALAVRYTAAFALAHHERELARDRTGKTALHKEVLAEMRALDAVAGKALGSAKGWISALREKLGEGGWLDRMLEWTFDADAEADEKTQELSQAVEDAVGGRGEAEEWASRVVESWREGVKGWGLVKWE